MVVLALEDHDYPRGQGEGANWEDEEERRFYENLVDLKARCSGLLEDGKRKKGEGEESGKGIDGESADSAEPSDEKAASGG